MRAKHFCALLCWMWVCAVATAAPQRKPQAMRVEVQVLAPGPVVYAFSSTGSLESDLERVSAEVAGVVRKLEFEEGDEVKKGQSLAAVDPEKYRLLVRKARAAWEKAQAQMQEAQNALTRRRSLREKGEGWVSDEEILHYTASLDEARAANDEAQALLNLAEEDEQRSRIAAPADGRIEKRHVVLGQHLQTGDLVASLVDLRSMRLRFRVTEKESARLAPGQVVAFRTGAMAEREFSGAVHHVASQADSRTRAVECVATVKNPDQILKAGWFAEVRIEVERKDQAVVVPENALFPTERGYVAFVVAGGKARERLVTLGLHTSGGQVEILSGLTAGEMLVTRGAQMLTDGAAVEVMESK